jgi:hypothetical protein
METRRERSPLRWPLLAVVILALNAMGVGWIVWSKLHGSLVASGGSASAHYRYFEHADGSLVEVFEDQVAGVVISVTTVRPPTILGLVALWGPLGISLILSVLAIVLVRTEAGRRAVRTLSRPRLTMLHGMVAIGAISVWLWLSKIHWVVLLGGIVVLVLMIHSTFRRARLAKEIERGEMDSPVLTRVGLVGYSIAALLAVAWVVCILVWDSYQHGVY